MAEGDTPPAPSPADTPAPPSTDTPAPAPPPAPIKIFISGNSGNKVVSYCKPMPMLMHHYQQREDKFMPGDEPGGRNRTC